jgi:hypothetical protein
MPEFLRHISRSSLICVASSFMLLVVNEVMYIRAASQVASHQGALIPILLLLPVAYALRGLWLLHKFAKRMNVEKEGDVGSLAVNFAAMPVLTYLLIADVLRFFPR